MTAQPFILEEGIASGGGPNAFAAMLCLHGMACAAEQIFLEPDPTPNVIGAIIQVRIAGSLYDATPCPLAHLTAIVARFRGLADTFDTVDGLSMGRIPVSLAGVRHEIGVVIFDERRLCLFFPRVSFDRGAAWTLLQSVATEGHLIEFQDDQFGLPVSVSTPA